MAATTPPTRVPPEREREGARIPPLFARLSRQRPHRRAAGYAIATAGTAGLTLSLLPFRANITPLSEGFGFLIIVVVSAAVGGLGPGILASVVDFLTFNFFFLPPYDTFRLSRGQDVVVLFVFLGLSILISALLARATERAETAEAREVELRTLQDLSAELVAVVPGPDTYGPVLARLLDLFAFAGGSLLVQDQQSHELREQVSVGEAPSQSALRWAPGSPGHPPERLPLSVGGRLLGLFVLHGERPPLTPAESRILRAFCDEFALALERDRLLQTATEAELYRQTDQVRKSLLAAVSHDLRSPLAAIKASVTDLLAEGASTDPAYAREALESIDDETDRLGSLIANLLDMSKIEGGILRARVQSVDLTELLSTCVDRVHRQWRDAARRGEDRRGGLGRARRPDLLGQSGHQPA